MKTSTKYNKVVKVTEDNEITILRESFNNITFKGLTGALLYPISKKEYKEKTSLKNVIENLEVNFFGFDIPYEFMYTEDGNLNETPYKDWALYLIEYGEVDKLIFDNSFSELWDYIREELNLSKEDAYIFNCIGGGRVFNKNDKFTHNKDLEYLLLEFEV